MTTQPDPAALWAALVQWQPATAAALADHLRSLPADWLPRELQVARLDAALTLPPGAEGEQYPDRRPEIAPYDEIATLDDCPACEEAEANCRFHEGYAAGHHEAAQAQLDAVKARSGISLRDFMLWQADVAEAADRGEVAPELPGSSATLSAGMPLVQGRCPACGTAGLFLGSGGYVTCSSPDCQEPDAASTVFERQPVPVTDAERRARYEAAFGPNMRLGLQDAELFDEPGAQRINEWITWITDAVMAVADAELSQVRAERDAFADRVDTLTAVAKGNKRHAQEMYADLQKAQAALSSPTGAVLAEVHAERARQDEKWGEQNHPDIDPRDIPYVSHGYYASRADIWRQVNEERATPSKTVGRCWGHPEEPHTHTAWDGVLLEEVYEALAEEDPARLRAELIQVAAVAVAWVEAIDRRAAAPAEGSDH